MLQFIFNTWVQQSLKCSYDVTLRRVSILRPGCTYVRRPKPLFHGRHNFRCSQLSLLHNVLSIYSDFLCLFDEHLLYSFKLVLYLFSFCGTRYPKCQSVAHAIPKCQSVAHGIPSASLWHTVSPSASRPKHILI